MSDQEKANEYAPDEEPSTDDLQEPSTEKEPKEAPKAPDPEGAEPDHQAVGIGVIGEPADEESRQDVENA